MKKKQPIISREEILEQIRNFRLMDDEFMTKVFDENIPCTQLVLRIILDKPDLIVKEVHAQYPLANLRRRSVRLDVFAVDSEGKAYNIEVQRKDAGADARRARYNSSLLDANITEAGRKFENLTETYVIFITERDIFGAGQAVYEIERMIRGTDICFDDGAHIRYVNGEYRGDTPVGRLMHDFFCTKPDEMQYSELAERTRYFKEDEEGVNSMSSGMEKLMDRYYLERNKEGIKELLRNGVAPNLIAKALKISIADVEALARTLHE
ncbi:MAG: hypothetical protein IJ493_06675 [Clostridia bacterium]|nr:hypothetical protein [Clostridia bacterium]